MVKQDEDRNDPSYITGEGLHYVNPAPVLDDDGMVKKPTRPYNHFFVKDTSNGAPRTTVTPVTVRENDGSFVCTPYSIYKHVPAQSYDINKPIEEVEPADFNGLPLLLFPGDKLVAIGGLEQVTLSDAKQ